MRKFEKSFHEGLGVGAGDFWTVGVVGAVGVFGAVGAVVADGAEGEGATNLVGANVPGVFRDGARVPEGVGAAVVEDGCLFGVTVGVPPGAGAPVGLVSAGVGRIVLAPVGELVFLVGLLGAEVEAGLEVGFLVIMATTGAGDREGCGNRVGFIVMEVGTLIGLMGRKGFAGFGLGLGLGLGFGRLGFLCGFIIIM